MRPSWVWRLVTSTVRPGSAAGLMRSVGSAWIPDARTGQIPVSQTLALAPCLSFIFPCLSERSEFVHFNVISVFFGGFAPCTPPEVPKSSLFRVL